MKQNLIAICTRVDPQRAKVRAKVKVRVKVLFWETAPHATPLISVVQLL